MITREKKTITERERETILNILSLALEGVVRCFDLMFNSWSFNDESNLRRIISNLELLYKNERISLSFHVQDEGVYNDLS